MKRSVLYRISGLLNVVVLSSLNIFDFIDLRKVAKTM